MIRNTNMVRLTHEELGVHLLQAINRSAPIEEIRALIERGADVNIADNNNGQTPLYNACRDNNAELVALLIERGAEVDTQDAYGQTPLYHACYYYNGNASILALLLKHGAKIDIQDQRGYTPLHHACVRNNLEIATFLIERGADVNIQDQRGYTPLHHACLHNNLEIANALLHHEAEVDLSLLKAFVGRNEWRQIDEIINNQTFQHVNLHLREDANIETIAILDMLYFSEDYAGLIHFVDNEGQPLINAIGEALPHFYEGVGLK